MAESSGGWTDSAPPPHRFHRVKRGSYEVVVIGRVIGRVVNCAEGEWAALTLHGTPAGPLSYYVRRDLATYALVMSPEGRAVWDSTAEAPLSLDGLEE